MAKDEALATHHRARWEARRRYDVIICARIATVSRWKGSLGENFVTIGGARSVEKYD